MKRLLLLAITTGFLAPLSASANLKDSGGYRACMAGLQTAWKHENPSATTTPELQSLFEETCLCSEDLVKNKKLSVLKAGEECMKKIWLVEGAEFDLQEEMSNDKETLELAIDHLAKILMEKDKRYNKINATKLLRCVLTAQVNEGLNKKQTGEKCKHLFYPNTPNLF